MESEIESEVIILKPLATKTSLEMHIEETPIVLHDANIVYVKVENVVEDSPHDRHSLIGIKVKSIKNIQGDFAYVGTVPEDKRNCITSTIKSLEETKLEPEYNWSTKLRGTIN